MNRRLARLWPFLLMTVAATGCAWSGSTLWIGVLAGSWAVLAVWVTIYDWRARRMFDAAALAAMTRPEPACGRPDMPRDRWLLLAMEEVANGPEPSSQEVPR